MRTFSKSIRVILVGTVALSWFSLVKADDRHCGVEEYHKVVQPETTSYRIIPGEYKWVEGAQGGASLIYKVVPAEFETLTESVVIPNDGLAQKSVVKTPSYPVAKFVQNRFENGRTRVQTKRPTFEAMTIPAQTKTLTRKKPCELVSSAAVGG